MDSANKDAIRLFPKSKPDDLSSYAHRQLIGYIGLLLPLLLYLIAGWRPVHGMPRWGQSALITTPARLLSSAELW